MDRQKNEIEDILNSLDGLRPATANPFLFEKIKARLDSRRRPETGRVILRWAFAAALAVILNIVTWTQFRQGARPSGELNAVAGQLGFSNPSYQY